MDARSLPVRFLMTGGTIAMTLDGGGELPRATLPPAAMGSQLLASVPELLQIAPIEQRLLFHLDSAEMGPEHWVTVARNVHDALSSDEVEGVVVVHGTDTLAYGASLVSLMLGPLPRAVVFTGAQRPLSAARTDARQNLVDATLAASHGARLPELSVVFGAQALRGVCATKIDAFGYDAFASPDAEPLLSFGIEVQQGHTLRAPSPLAPFDPRLEPRVMALQVVPTLTASWLEAVLATGVRGLVLSTYGTGTLPGRLLGALERARERGVTVLAVSQCGRGHVELSRYEAGARAEQVGVLSGGAMTVEAALAKLMIGLGRFDDPAQLRDYLLTCQVGELGDR